jgi:hypothetical protein
MPRRVLGEAAGWACAERLERRVTAEHTRKIVLSFISIHRNHG